MVVKPICLIFFSICCFTYVSSQEKKKHARVLTPVFLVHGIFGTNLYIKFKDGNIDPACYEEFKKQDFKIWPNMDLFMTSQRFGCWMKYMKLTLDPVTSTTKDVEGVEILIDDFNVTSGVERIEAQPVFEPFVNVLVKKMNYTRGKNLFGANYDFRKAPCTCLFA